MKTILTSMLLIVMTALMSGSTFALENSSENREKQADRYLQVNSPQDIFEDIAERTRVTLSSSEQHDFIISLTEYLDMEVLANAMKTSLVTHFTAEEIAALADFYSMPGSKSAMNKMGVYMSDVLPVVHEEMLKAQEKASAAQQEIMEIQAQQ